MESLKLSLCLPCICWWSSAEKSSFVAPPTRLIFASVGDTIAMKCPWEKDSMKPLHWYEQTQGEKTTLITTTPKVVPTASSSEELFVNNPQFTVNRVQNRYQLTIANVSISDSKMYICASGQHYTFQYESIFVVHVVSSPLSVPVEVHKSPSESIQSGGSVTLSCTVETGSCDEEHTVYWFKNSGESEAELIYTNRSRKALCESKTNICFYNVSMNNLNISKVGSYYCVVAACGHILFGAGTKLDMNNNASCSDHLQSALTGALVLTNILCVLLALSLFKIHKRSSSQCTDIPTAPSHDVAGTDEEEYLNYSAVRFHKGNESRKKTERDENICVYSSVVQ
uniref:Immune-type receptor 1 n=1 Tax=Sphoeroides nephelus TaxID=39110 RepID=Q9IB09_9TELE|nr:immune-type receptor 1 [Sphoeroides nephelus]